MSVLKPHLCLPGFDAYCEAKFAQLFAQKPSTLGNYIRFAALRCRLSMTGRDRINYWRLMAFARSGGERGIRTPDRV